MLKVKRHTFKDEKSIVKTRYFWMALSAYETNSFDTWKCDRGICFQRSRLPEDVL